MDPLSSDVKSERKSSDFVTFSTRVIRRRYTIIDDHRIERATPSELRNTRIYVRIYIYKILHMISRTVYLASD